MRQNIWAPLSVRKQPENFARWQDRDLSEHKILYLFCDGIYLRLRPEDAKPVAVLCAYGIKDDGGKVLLHLEAGDKESTVCWKSFFEDFEAKRNNLKSCL